MLLNRRSFTVLSTAMVTCVAAGIRAVASPLRQEDAFETFRRLSQDAHLELVSGFVRQNMAGSDGPMWTGRMSQNYISVLPAALASGASSFDEVKRAFSLDFLVSAQRDERVPAFMRNRLRSAISVIPAYDEAKGTEQGEIFHDHLNFMFSGFGRMISELSVGYPGSARDMANGVFDWERTSELLL
ncbi:hypothetical protein [Rhizobium sp. MHM7A]|uniref:hypothetical protein n=1 Tax=Rhizobium sp. MHM7A TaxID=2583233 RepID=UPI0014874C51|nr:hypothetical protein [Rhizobium sp. MHM7A]